MPELERQVVESREYTQLCRCQFRKLVVADARRVLILHRKRT